MKEHIQKLRLHCNSNINNFGTSINTKGFIWVATTICSMIMSALQPGNTLSQNLLALCVMILQLILTIPPGMARAESLTYSNPFLPLIAGLRVIFACRNIRPMMSCLEMFTLYTLAGISYVQLQIRGCEGVAPHTMLPGQVIRATERCRRGSGVRCTPGICTSTAPLPFSCKLLLLGCRCAHLMANLTYSCVLRGSGYGRYGLLGPVYSMPSNTRTQRKPNHEPNFGCKHKWVCWSKCARPAACAIR